MEKDFTTMNLPRKLALRCIHMFTRIVLRRNTSHSRKTAILKHHWNLNFLRTLLIFFFFTASYDRLKFLFLNNGKKSMKIMFKNLETFNNFK